MKIITDLLEEDRLLLEVRSTLNEPREFNLPKINLHYWYPFNLNYHYKYSDSRDFLYLVKDKGYEGPPIYEVNILRRTQQLPQRNDVMFNQHVFRRNMYIMTKAAQMGIKTVKELFDEDDVDDGFATVGAAIETIKERIEDRYIEACEDPATFQGMPTEEYDAVIFSYMTEEERAELVELGEIYSMLVLMKKMIEGS